MKIALIGNMNNNNFAIMRYFRDLGADAHLLLWSNDGCGSLAHFTPESDTWEIDKWKPYIHQTDIASTIITLLGDPRRLRLPTRASKIKSQLGGYEAYVGSGYAPAILARAGIRLDLFYPYAVGIEGAGDFRTRAYFKTRSWWRKALVGMARNRQIAGIRNARHCLNAEMSLTRQTFAEMEKDFLPLAIPMVYNREVPSAAGLPPILGEISQRLADYDLRILSHARQLWVRASEGGVAAVESCLKYNDWLIRGFAQFLADHSHVKALLVLFEYGQDVQASKELIAALGIGAHVMWLPRMSRKEILCLLGFCDIGVGGLGTRKGSLWGGTGWEVLASGRPLLQSVDLSANEFRKTFGHDLPPILDVKSPEDITRHLIDFARNREKYEAIGKRSQEWFNAHNGIGLAKQWLELLKR